MGGGVAVLRVAKPDVSESGLGPELKNFRSLPSAFVNEILPRFWIQLALCSRFCSSFPGFPHLYLFFLLFSYL